MKSILEKFILWLSKKLQPIVEQKFSIEKTYEIERVVQKSIKLPYVLLENENRVINKFRIPVKLEDVKLKIFNKGLEVGEILYQGSIRIPAQGEKKIKMEIRLNHITAFFQMLRFLIVDKIKMDVIGEVHIKFLKMDFFIPVTDIIELPKNKLQLVKERIEMEEPLITDLPFEEIPAKDDTIEDTNDTNQDGFSDESEHTPTQS